MAGRNVMGRIFDEKACCEFEQNNPVLFPEGEPHQGFELTASQRNQLVSIFSNVDMTHDAQNVSEADRLRTAFAILDYSKLSTLAIRAQASALAAARFAEQASTVNRSLTTVSSGGPNLCWWILRCVWFGQ